MNVLLIGAGGREHALAWKLKRDDSAVKLFLVPGNAGVNSLGTPVTLDVLQSEAVAAFCRDNDINLVVVGPEAPLVAGLVDDLTAAGINAFGPTKAAAQLEGSKTFTKTSRKCRRE